MKERYELTEEDIQDKKQYIVKLLKVGIPFIICIIAYLLIEGGLKSVFELISIPLFVITFIYLVKVLIRTRFYYERRHYAKVAKAKSFYKNNPKRFHKLRNLIDRVQTKTLKYGFNIFEICDNSELSDNLETIYFPDFKYYTEAGEIYPVWLARYGNHVIISHLNIYHILSSYIAFKLIDDFEDYDSIANVVSNLADYSRTFDYRYDMRREGGYVVVVPTCNIRLTNISSNKARLSFGSEIGVENIDLYISSGDDYEKFADLIS